MTETQALSEVEDEVYRMEESWLWYLAGAFDTVGRIKVKIRKGDAYQFGYYAMPEVSLSRPEDATILFEMMNEYCWEHNVDMSIENQGNGSSKRAIIDDPESIKQFFEPILPALVQQKERAEIMVEDVLPHFENGSPTTQGDFARMVLSVEKLQSEPIQSKRETKYNIDYFEEQWGNLSRYSNSSRTR